MKIPANDQALILPDFDPRQLVKVVAAGVLSAGSAYLSSFRNPPAINSDVLTADEVADLLRLDRKTVYDYAGRGVIPCQRIGKRMLFSRVAVVQWLGGCSKGSSNGGSG